MTAIRAESREIAERFPWPATSVGGAPSWAFDRFLVDGRPEPILAYTDTESGWHDDLNLMHADAGGGMHPIDRASRRLALRVLGESVIRPGSVLMDAGCSDGAMLRDLCTAAPGALVIGSDFLPAPMLRLHRLMPRVPLLQFDLRHCPLPDACIDGITCLNVLEHIDDDDAALRQLLRILKPGGRLALELPAGPHLYDFYDSRLMHHRRYRMRDLIAKMVAAGFRIDWHTHLGCLVYPPFAWTKRRNQRRQHLIDEQQSFAEIHREIRSSSNALVSTALAIELALGRLVRWPFGIRCVVAAHRPGPTPA